MGHGQPRVENERESMSSTCPGCIGLDFSDANL